MNTNSHQRTLPYWRKSTSLHFSVGLVLSLTLVTTAFEWNFRNDLTSDPINTLKVAPGTEIELIVIDEPVPARPKVPDFMEPSTDVTEPSEPVEAPDIPTDIIEVPDGKDIPDLSNLFGNDPLGTEKADNTVYNLIPATPQESMEAFYHYLYKNIRYPVHLTSGNITGKVEVSFVVDKDGKITDVKILKGFDKSLEKEIVRILKNAPEWEPAQLGPEKVRTQHRIPFSFNIQ